MNKSSLKARSHFRKLLVLRRLETGFSMLEAVVVVGVLLALAVGGFFAYGPITENAKRAVVKSAASETHTAVIAADVDGDSSTKPQGVIDTYNKSTDKIKVEILEPAAAIGAMSTTEAAPTANGDFCIQATNVESPYITAREGACDDVTEGSNPGPDTGSGTPIPPITFSPTGDWNHNGIPNSLDAAPAGTPSEDVSGADKGDGISAATVGTTSGDGSGNFNDAQTSYGHAHEPISPNVLGPGAVELTGWSFDKASPRDINITFWADGKPHGGVGGNFIVSGHVDLTCYQPMNNKVTERTADYSAMMQEPYVTHPLATPNSHTVAVWCASGETVLKAVFRPATDTQWRHYGTGNGYYWEFTRIVTEGWVNPDWKG